MDWELEQQQADREIARGEWEGGNWDWESMGGRGCGSVWVHIYLMIGGLKKGVGRWEKGGCKKDLDLVKLVYDFGFGVVLGNIYGKFMILKIEKL